MDELRIPDTDVVFFDAPPTRDAAEWRAYADMWRRHGATFAARYAADIDDLVRRIEAGTDDEDVWRWHPVHWVKTAPWDEFPAQTQAWIARYWPQRGDDVARSDPGQIVAGAAAKSRQDRDFQKDE